MRKPFIVTANILALSISFLGTARAQQTSPPNPQQAPAAKDAQPSAEKSQQAPAAKSAQAPATKTQNDLTLQTQKTRKATPSA